MARRRGKTPWYETITDKLHRQIDEALDLTDESAPDIYERLSLSSHTSERSFQAYASKRRGPSRRTGDSRLRTAGTVVRALTDGCSDFADLERQILDQVVNAILSGEAEPYELEKLARVVIAFRKIAFEANRDHRDGEKHAAWREAHNKKVLVEAAKKAKSSGGKLTVADVAKMLEEIDLAEAAA